MSATLLLSVMAASLAVPQAGSTFSSAANAAQGNGSAAMVRLFVSPDRLVEDCKVISSDMSKSDDARVCASLRGKRAAKAAEGPDGQPAYGTLVYLVAGRVNEPSDAARFAHPDVPADLVLNVESLPDNRPTKSISVNVLLDNGGKVVRCEPGEGDGGAFSKAACASLDQQAIQVRHAKDGKAVPYVDNLMVTFVSKQAKT